MGSEEMLEGELYALKIAGGECVPVMLKSKSARRAGRVVVVPRHGDEDTTGIEVRREQIVGTWDAYEVENVVLVDTAAFSDVAWLPQPGEEVTLAVTGEIRWTVEEVDLHEEKAVVRSPLFGGEQVRTEPIVRLRPTNKPPSSEELDEWFGEGDTERYVPDPPAASDQTSTSTAPTSASILPDAIADRLVFSDGACAQYRKLEPRCRRGDEQKRMRSEVSRHGRLGRTRHRRGVVRYVVPRRFEFGVDEDPSTTDRGIWVDKITVIRRKPRNRRRPRSGGRRGNRGKGRK